MPSVWMRQWPSNTDHRCGQSVSSPLGHRSPKHCQDSKSFMIWPHPPLRPLLLLLSHCVLCSSQAEPRAIPGTYISPTLPTIFSQMGRLFHLTDPKPGLSLLSLVRLSPASPGKGTHWHPRTGCLLLPVCSFPLALDILDLNCLVICLTLSPHCELPEGMNHVFCLSLNPQGT